MKSILLIEPDFYSANLYSGALTNLGVTIEVASNAQAALDALDKKIFDGIILELDLKGHNGLEFLYEFNSHIDWSEIPIIVHSNLNPDSLSHMSAGWSEFNVVEFLYKARTSLKDLQAAVTNLLPTKIN